MKLLFTLIFSALGLTLCAQELSTTAEKTQQHIQIAGTQVWMALPDSFELSNKVRGYSRPSDPLSIFVITEMPASYRELSKAIQPEQLQNITFSSVQHGTLHGDSATLVSIEQIYNTVFFKKYILCTGDSNNTVVINCVFPRDSVALGEKMKAALYTTLVEKKTAAERRALLNYTLDEKKTPLKFAGVVGNGMLFNDNGVIAAMKESPVMFAADKSFLNDPILDQKDFCEARVHMLNKNQAVSVKGSPKAITIDGLRGYELQAVAKDEEKKARYNIYQVILFSPDAYYYIFVGIANETEKVDIGMFKELARTFKRK